MKKTPLYEEHKAAGANLIDFGGWEMPVYYTSIIEEHNHVRARAGAFDVSHMGEFLVEGKDSMAFIQKLITNNAEKLEDNQICYTPMCYEDGKIVDDLLVYRHAEDRFMLVVNAANIEKDLEWIKKNSEGMEVSIVDMSEMYAEIALQGPEAQEALQIMTDKDLTEIGFFRFADINIGGHQCIVSRTGYTGEDGFEIYTDNEAVVDIWKKLMSYGVKPIGLGARDTLRFEACLMLYGNDIDDTTTPIEAGLSWTVKLKKPDFIGRKVIEKQKKKGTVRKLVGFEMVDRGIPRHGYDIVDNGGEKIGYVTSGSHTPFLKKNLGMGYVPTEMAEEGTDLMIKIRDQQVKAKVVAKPFYKKQYKKE